MNQRLEIANPDDELGRLSMASPVYRGELWRMRDSVGKSIRTYRRSVIAPAIELHPEESGRMEFKLFKATNSLADYHAYFLLWLTLLLDEGLPGGARDQTRIYDLGAVARCGLDAEAVRDRIDTVLVRSTDVLDRHGFDPGPLAEMRKRLESNHLPADAITACVEDHRSLAELLRRRTGLCKESELPGVTQDARNVVETSC